MSGNISNIAKSLDELDIHFNSHGLKIDIDWFRLKWKTDSQHTFWHKHSNIEIHYVLEGMLCVETEQKTLCVSSGEVLVISPDTPHRLRITSDQYHMRFVINCSITTTEEDSGARALVQLFGDPPLIPIKLSKQARQLMLNILDEAEAGDFGFCSVIEADFIIFLYMISRKFGEYTKQEAQAQNINVKKNLYNLRMESILCFLQKNVYQKCSVTDLAEGMNLSISQLERTIKYCTQKTPIKIIQQVKIDKAKELLRDRNLSIRDISDMLGFVNEYDFNRIFKRIEGMPPGKYRVGLYK
jgi:AraC-like DNA-binding protein